MAFRKCKDMPSMYEPLRSGVGLSRQCTGLIAAAVCNRVFYMDQGGIYEDGPPDQVFDKPQRDLTRRFIRKLKILELNIDDPDFDFTGAGTKIDGYCLRNDISPSTKYHIHLAFEELACNILGPVLDRTPVLITIEHSEKDDVTEVTASYGGEKFDPAESEDSFSYEVLRSMVKSVSYHYDPEIERANTVNVMV